MTKEKYLEKIENDIQERMYEILMIHLQDVHKKIPKIKEHTFMAILSIPQFSATLSTSLSANCLSLLMK